MAPHADSPMAAGAPKAEPISTLPRLRLGSLAVLLLSLVTTLPPAARAQSQVCDKREPTRQTGPGPHDYSAAVADTRLWHEADSGEPLFLRARVLDTCGRPIHGARVQILHANQHGDHEPDRWRAVLNTDAKGTFKVVTVYPGYAGSIARHIHFAITHASHKPLHTRLFFQNDPSVGQGIADLAMVLEEIEHSGRRGWVASYEFVLTPQ